VQQQAHQKVMTGNGQLTKVHDEMIKKESISDIKTQKYGLFFSNYVFPNEYLYISSLCSCLLKYRIMSISCLDKTKPLKVLSPSPRLQKGTTGDYPLSNQANTYIAVPILAKPLKCSENLPCPLPQKNRGVKGGCPTFVP
jgi:hypothetical protein